MTQINFHDEAAARAHAPCSAGSGHANAAPCSISEVIMADACAPAPPSAETAPLRLPLASSSALDSPAASSTRTPYVGESRSSPAPPAPGAGARSSGAAGNAANESGGNAASTEAAKEAESLAGSTSAPSTRVAASTLLRGASIASSITGSTAPAGGESRSATTAAAAGGVATRTTGGGTYAHSVTTRDARTGSSLRDQRGAETMKYPTTTKRTEVARRH